MAFFLTFKMPKTNQNKQKNSAVNAVANLLLLQNSAQSVVQNNQVQAFALAVALNLMTVQNSVRSVAKKFEVTYDRFRPNAKPERSHRIQV